MSAKEWAEAMEVGKYKFSSETDMFQISIESYHVCLETVRSKIGEVNWY